MLKRLTLFSAAAAVGSAAASFMTGRKAKAAVSKLDFDYEPRGTRGRLERLPTLDVESRDDFVTGIRAWGQPNALHKMERNRFHRLMEKAGIDTEAEDVPLEDIFKAIEGDPLLGVGIRYRSDVQALMYKNLNTEFSENADLYLDELEAFDKSGPGTLELNPDMHVPIYTRYEIHCMPGGFVGHPLGGYINYYGSNSFYGGRREANRQDQVHTAMAHDVPVPEDGKVLRVLDLGCGVGKLAVGLKERFPDAEVWGVDVAAPMLRFGHMRAVDLGVEVHLAQRLAEDTKFPDEHFDIVASYIVHHEVSAQATIDISKEVFRILRPGGVYVPYDFYTGAEPKRTTPYYMYTMWKDHRWNFEVWREQYRMLDFSQTFRDAGFEVNENGPPGWRYDSNFLATKPV